MMRATRPAQGFRLTWEERASGWIGDPDVLVVRSIPLEHKRRRSVVAGVADALRSLGW
jgi:hypothetical protein